MCLFQRSMKYLSQFFSYFFIALSQTTRGKRRKSRRIYHKKIVNKVFSLFLRIRHNRAKKYNTEKSAGQIDRFCSSYSSIFFLFCLSLSFFLFPINRRRRTRRRNDGFSKGPKFQKKRRRKKSFSPARVEVSSKKRKRKKSPLSSDFSFFFSPSSSSSFFFPPTANTVSTQLTTGKSPIQFFFLLSSPSG